MKIKVGIVGYGNLGKSVEKTLLSNSNIELVAIFSRRLTKSIFNTKVEPYENYIQYKNKIDVMFLCGGSKNDIELQAPEIAKYFDTINSFDTHSKILKLKNILNKITVSSSHRAIIACGWDPGLFSTFRLMSYAISKSEPITFWGKGISMGHSDAIRQIDGVIDGIEFTIPNSDAVKLAKAGKLDSNTKKHTRKCYVVAKKIDEPRIEYEIRNIPNYFAGEIVDIEFVSQIELLKLKSKLLHTGEVLCNFKTFSGSKNLMSLKVQIQSNPDFTASIMVAYLNAITNLRQKKMTGAYLPFEIPIIDLFPSSQKDKIIEKLC